MTKLKNRKERDQFGRLLVDAFEEVYLGKPRMYRHAFWRGVVGGVGGVIGATLVVAILVWVLGLFQSLPIIKPVVRTIRSTIQQAEVAK